MSARTITRIFHHLLGPRYTLYYRMNPVTNHNITTSNAYIKHYKQLQNNYNTYNPLNARRHGFSRNKNKMALTVLKRILNNTESYIHNSEKGNKLNTNTLGNVTLYPKHNESNRIRKLRLRSYLIKKKLKSNLNRSQLHAYKLSQKTGKNPLNILANNLQSRRRNRHVRNSFNNPNQQRYRRYERHIIEYKPNLKLMLFKH